MILVYSDRHLISLSRQTDSTWPQAEQVICKTCPERRRQIGRRLLIYIQANEGSSDTIANVAYGSQAMQLLGSVDGAGGFS